ncbi:uncharacterized protein LOC133186814 [Saccostrea echinata]|uniref:uncharacterized protein LOC133186814 n=1 Tax=Saccostrea echinata TaxID=191078 RepID=UPI002A7F043D|nr:uncharacterized protein LOC133186814 [Saccostrea echinata]
MYILTLYSKPHCASEEETIIMESEIKNETNYRFYQLNLKSEVPYFVRLKVVNRAGLSTEITSVPIYVDMTEPLLGDIKPGLDWAGSKPIQFSQSEIHAVLAVAKTKRVYKCPRQQKFPFSAFRTISNFSSECTDITLEHLDIIIRHDDTLQKIIKGGVRSDLLNIKSGVYSYRVKPLGGQNMTTIIGLSSDLLHIPLHFTEQINSDSNSSTSNATGPPDVYAIGIAIRGYPNDEIREIILWAKDRYETHTRILNFEKEKSFVDIDFELESIKDDSGYKVTWSVKYFIDKQEVVRFTGLVFQNRWSMFLLTNNNNGFFPPITDVFHPFYAVSRFTNIQVPLDIDHDCQYGKAFFDEESHIKEIWAGVSDSINRTDNVKPLQLVIEFCQPCNKICPDMCDKNCSTENEFQIIPIKITNLTLLSSSVANEGVQNRTFDTSNGSTVFDLYETPAYFVTAKIVNQAGLQVLLHSPAITIDTTPPEFVKMECVDPDHSMTEPANYQSSLKSLGAFWECNEDVGQIIRYVISVGVSMNDTNVLNETNIGLNTTFRADDLEGMLQNFTTYFISVHAYNSAGLHAKEFCNITVDLHAPDISKTDTAVLFKSPSIISAPPNITFLSSQNNIGVQWNPHTTDAEFYEWQIGSHDGEGDLLEKVKVGNSKSRSVAIVNGRMWLDNQKTNTTLAEFVLKTWDNKSIAEAKKNAFFNIEPGKCFHMGLFAISRSHLSSQLPLDANCYLRPTDHLVSFHSRKIQTVHLTNGRFVDVTQHSTLKSNLIIKLQGSKGDISFGVLTRNDTRMNYGSAGGPNYKSYIVDPNTTASQTSRALQRRILKFSDLSFFMSPSCEADINRWIDFTLTVNKSDLVESTQPTLVIWNRAKEEWQIFDDHCKQNIQMDHVQSTLKGKICINDPGHDRIRRQTYQTVILTEPRQFALVIIKKELQNSPPIIKKTQKTIDEDGFLHYNLEWEDSENDNITFKLIDGPFHGNANITEEGIIDYQPNPNFFGKDTVHIGITEIISETGSQELVNQFNITFDILIENINDGPSILFGTSSNETFDSKSHNKIDVIVEANDAEYFIGSFVAFDIDQNDSLTYQVYSNGSDDMVFDLQEKDRPNSFLLEFISNSTTPPTVLKSFDLYLKLNVSAYGYVEYGLLVYDSVKWYSKAVWFQIFVLRNPCVHGHCERIFPSGLDCNDKMRSVSFEKFKCACDKGYEGIYCGNEIDECVPNPCPLMYDCLDELADYTCTINPAKLMAILICICITFLLIIFVYRKKKQAKKKMKVSDFWHETPSNQMAGPSGTFPVESNQQVSDYDEEDQPLPQEKSVDSENEHLGETINILELTSMFASRSKKTLPPHHVGRIRSQDCKPGTSSSKKPSIHTQDGGVPNVNI